MSRYFSYNLRQKRRKKFKKNLEKFLNQDYDNYELIVVNDRSWDNSLEFLNNLKKKYLKLKVVDIPDNQTDHFGKKLALTLGIKAAKNNHLLFTDADCFPILILGFLIWVVDFK